jgi:hypothetical protein
VAAPRRATSQGGPRYLGERTICAFAETLSVSPRSYILTNDDGRFVVFYFARAEDAVAFCEEFGGKLLPVTG